MIAPLFLLLVQHIIGKYRTCDVAVYFPVQHTAIQGPTIRYLSQLKVTSVWYKLGQQLGVSPQKLDSFRQDYPRDEEICKNKMFGVWLGSSNANFHNLLIGLMAIGRKELAESISEKEGQLVLNCMCPQSVDINAAISSTSKFSIVNM